MVNHIVLLAFMVNRNYILALKLIEVGRFVTLLLHLLKLLFLSIYNLNEPTMSDLIQNYQSTYKSEILSQIMFIYYHL